MSLTIVSVVSNPNSLFLVFEFQQGDNGPENFLLSDFHFWCYVGENGGLDDKFTTATAARIGRLFWTTIKALSGTSISD